MEVPHLKVKPLSQIISIKSNKVEKLIFLKELLLSKLATLEK